MIRFGNGKPRIFFQDDRWGHETPYLATNVCGYVDQHWYNYPMLDDTMTGNYIIVCGNCGHEHYRTIVKGVVTDDRHSANYKTAERLHVMKSATQPTKRQLGLVAQFRQMEAAGLASAPPERE